MSRLPRRFILYGLGILSIIAIFASIVVASNRSSAAGNAGSLTGTKFQAMSETATPGCGVGGAPALKANRVSGPMGQLVAGPIVIGCGRRNQELIQLVAFHTTRQLCAEMERPSKEQVVGGVCKPVDMTWNDYCVKLCIASVLPADTGPHHRYRHATLFGEAHSELTNIKAVLHEPRRVRTVSTIEGRVESTDMLEALRETEPFVVFGTVLRPCTPPQSLEVVATDKNGVVRRRGVMSLPHICSTAVRP